MASSDPEIKNGFSPPVWMKNKQSKDFEAFAGSPPAPEDSFFYIRYPKADVVFGRSKTQQELPNVLTEPPKDVKAATAFNTKEKDWSKHTKPCQDVLHGIVPINTAASGVAAKPKPAGVDDGFKGEGAACGSSIVKVAHQMISSNPRGGGGGGGGGSGSGSGGGGGRGFTVATPAEDAEAAAEAAQHLRARRGSRSLPVTPSSSPTTRRKMNGNRYFTSPFEPTEDASSRSWLTMALLGFKRDLAGSTSTLAEEDAIDARLGVSTLAQSVESLGPSPRDKHSRLLSSPAPPAPPAQAFRPKPSELREMNFWSPTSM